MQLSSTKINWILSAAKIAVLICSAILVFSFFQMSFSTPEAYAITGAATESINTAREKAANNESGLLSSAIGAIGDGIAWVVYMIMVGLGSGFAYIGALFFGIAVGISLNSAAYALVFLEQGWQMVRDIANMAFIFILIFIALTIMLKAETHGTMQMLAKVIVVALLINFSFFLTRVVIDAGNILAVQFYNAIEAPTIGQTIQDSGATISTTASLGGSANNKDLTASIMNAIGVQRAIGTESFGKLGQGSNPQGDPIVLIFVYILTGVVFFLLGILFFVIGFKFLVRIIILWFTIIAAPLAFILAAMPGSAPLSYFRQWLRALVVFSFYPAIFLFLFLIITSFVSNFTNLSDLVGSLSSSNNNLQGAMYYAVMFAEIAIRLGFVIILLLLALKISDKVAAFGGTMAQTIMNKASSYTGNIGGRLGGFAFQQSAGRVAAAASSSLQTGRAGQFLYNRGGRFGYWIGDKARRSITQPIAAMSVGGAQSRQQVIDRTTRESRERTDTVRNIDNRQVVDRVVTAINSNQRPAQQDEDRIRNFGERELGNLSARQLASIAHLLTQNRIQSLERNDRITDAERESIVEAWNRRGVVNNPLPGQPLNQVGSPEAPINRADRIVEEIQRLQTAVGVVGLNINNNTRITRQEINNAVHAIDNQTSVFQSRLEAARGELTHAIETGNAAQRRAAEVNIARELTNIRNLSQLSTQLIDLRNVTQTIREHTSHRNNVRVPAGEFYPR